ncbi:hypothetical protein Ahy_Scaffold1g107112 isoform C [Arachis hypogaea]|uniref:Uncharacterized protein n=1 Tax=Arachis hypogaea TaxID=3818 RepID=A0A444WUJ2_ARAHY|nr:hypothetical protein Ahy_Scaffold1g107112 isoform C [Arachis hypogaea]
MAEERYSGVVQWFSNSKGFGFIKPDQGGDDLFVHHSSIQSDGAFRTLVDGDRVEFSIADNSDKPKALDVTGPNGAPLRSAHDSARAGNDNRRSAGAGGGGGGGACYQCGDFGHLARDCSRAGNGGGGGGGGACYSCGGFGHMARDCVSGGGGGGANGWDAKNPDFSYLTAFLFLF